jgi:hypothetical protein
MSLDTALDTLHATRQIPLPQLITETLAVLNAVLDALPADTDGEVALLSRCQVLRYIYEHIECVPKEGL